MQTYPTAYADINQLLEILLSNMQKILGDKLIGLYLHGSLVIGDFDSAISDIDLVAALASRLNDKEFEELHKMHDDFAHQHQEWDNRIEVCYISLAALQMVKTKTSIVANISPGEPFHARESSREWLVKWYVIREKGIPLFGPSPKTIIEPISNEDFKDEVRAHLKAWNKWIYDMHTRKGLSYAILTMCRAMYSLKYGEQVSKKRAGLWAVKEFPEWAALIDQALEWRESKLDEDADEVAFQKTLEFVRFGIRESLR